MSTSGRTWGKIAINNGNLMFTVDGKVAMDLPLRDVSQAQVWYATEPVVGQKSRTNCMWHNMHSTLPYNPFMPH